MTNNKRHHKRNHPKNNKRSNNKSNKSNSNNNSSNSSNNSNSSNKKNTIKNSKIKQVKNNNNKNKIYLKSHYPLLKPKNGVIKIRLLINKKRELSGRMFLLIYKVNVHKSKIRIKSKI